MADSEHISLYVERNLQSWYHDTFHCYKLVLFSKVKYVPDIEGRWVQLAEANTLQKTFRLWSAFLVRNQLCHEKKFNNGMILKLTPWNMKAVEME